MKTSFFTTLIYLLSTASAFSGNLDQGQQAALADTQALLKSDARLSEFTKGNPKAAGALDQFRGLTKGDPAKQAELQSISSDIFSQMVSDTHGDDSQLMGKLQEGLKNPSAFMNSLPPAQQARIKAMAAEIDGKK